MIWQAGVRRLRTKICTGRLLVSVLLIECEKQDPGICVDRRWKAGVHRVMQHGKGKGRRRCECGISGIDGRGNYGSCDVKKLGRAFASFSACFCICLQGSWTPVDHLELRSRSEVSQTRDGHSRSRISKT